MNRHVLYLEKSDWLLAFRNAKNPHGYPVDHQYGIIIRKAGEVVLV
jgi:hypothetical protein